MSSTPKEWKRFLSMKRSEEPWNIVQFGVFSALEISCKFGGIPPKENGVKIVGPCGSHEYSFNFPNEPWLLRRKTEMSHYTFRHRYPLIKSSGSFLSVFLFLNPMISCQPFPTILNIKPIPDDKEQKLQAITGWIELSGKLSETPPTLANSHRDFWMFNWTVQAPCGG